jgi:hypothetical protein
MQLLPTRLTAAALLSAAACSQHGAPGAATVPQDSSDTATAGASATGVITGFTHVGGEILEITLSDGTKLFPATLAQLTGTVYDSTKAGPVAGVRVAIAGTDFWSATDDIGAFHLAVPLDGEYAVSFSHPWLDSIGLGSANEHVGLARGSSSSVSFAIPSVATMVERLCADTLSRPDRTTIVGVVAGKDGTAVSNAAVTLSWQEIVPADSGFEPREFQRSAVTDEAGSFTLCDVPTGRPISLRAEHGRENSGSASLIFPWTGAGRLLLAWNRAPGQPYSLSYAAPHPIWKLDLQLNQDDSTQHPDQPKLLSGIVADRTTGQGIDAVSVVLNERDSTTTRDDGTFDIVNAHWVPGGNVVSFRRIGYRPWTQQLQLAEDRSELVLSPLLLSTAFALDPVIVEAERANRVAYLDDVGFFHRQQLGFGHQLDPTELERRLPGASDVLDFLYGIPNVSVTTDSEGAGSVGNKLVVFYTAGGVCVPRVYVDDIEIIDGARATSLASLVRPEDVLGIEVYRRLAETPIRFGRGCVLIIWTRRGR